MKNAPYAKVPFIKYYRMVRSDPIALRTEIFEKYGDINWRKMKGFINYNIGHPDYAQHILERNHDNYFPKSSLFRQIFTPAFGEKSLFIIDNIPQWHGIRKTTNISFEPRVYFQDYAHNIATLYKNTFTKWEQKYKPGDYIDIANEINKLSLAVLLNTMYIKLDMDPAVLDPVIAQCNRVIKHKLLSIFPLWYISPARSEYKKTLCAMRELTFNAVRKRMNSSEKWDDAVQYFIDNYKNIESTKTLEIIADQVITQFAAAYFNLASLLNWLFIVLSLYPDVERKISEEINHKLQHDLPTYDEINSLVYVPLVIKETLRLYPSSFAMARQAIAEDEIDGFYVPANAGVTISNFHINRHPDFWPNPQAFDPERFRDNILGQDHNFAYLPFGHGNRRCPAAAFSILSASLLISMLARRFKITLPPYTEVRPHATTIINMRPNITHMRFDIK